MSIQNMNKDHLKEHSGVQLVEPVLAPTSEDPLRFWTNHPSENTAVDLHVFADGEHENPGHGLWVGPFSGRPELIAEMALAIQARLTLAAPSTCSTYLSSLRKFWRIFDQLEAAEASHGRVVERLTSVTNLTHMHEAAAHRAVTNGPQFNKFVTLANDVRRLMRLGPLWWTTPSFGAPNRQLIPESQAKALKIAIKRDWEKVRKEWTRLDAIRRAEEPDTLTEREKQDDAIVFRYAEQNDELRRNWSHLERIQQTTGRILPSTEQLCGGVTTGGLLYRGLEVSLMRTIAFPTVLDADVAFHMALLGSGWNPSTLISGIDATLPERIFQHPKDAGQTVLAIDVPQDDGENIEEVTMQGSKRRAGGRMQFCMGLKKNPACPPAIVATYLERTAALRAQLRQDCEEARAELAWLKAEEAPSEAIECQFKHFQRLQQGLRNVWLYVDRHGNINWINGKIWTRYRTPHTKSGRCSYVEHVISRLNVERAAHGDSQIAGIEPSDFRDIYARWVHVQKGGNVLAVMFALGHASLRSTNAYTDNNIFNAENDATVLRFMTRLFAELGQGRVDLTILAQLVRHGPLTSQMQEQLGEYRSLMLSRVKVGCADAKHPPAHISPDHVQGKWCGTQRCLRDCPHARFLPESVDGISMRVEELVVMSQYLPLETWARGDYEKELEAGEFLLNELYPQDAVSKARNRWREKIRTGNHFVRGVGLFGDEEGE